MLLRATCFLPPGARSILLTPLGWMRALQAPEMSPFANNVKSQSSFYIWFLSINPVWLPTSPHLTWTLWIQRWSAQQSFGLHSVSLGAPSFHLPAHPEHVCSLSTRFSWSFSKATTSQNEVSFSLNPLMLTSCHTSHLYTCQYSPSLKTQNIKYKYTQVYVFKTQFRVICFISMPHGAWPWDTDNRHPISPCWTFEPTASYRLGQTAGVYDVSQCERLVLP